MTDSKDDAKDSEEAKPSEDSQVPDQADQPDQKEEQETEEQEGQAADVDLAAEGTDVDQENVDNLLSSLESGEPLPEGETSAETPETNGVFSGMTQMDQGVPNAASESKAKNSLKSRSANPESLDNILKIKVPFKMILAQKKSRMRDVMALQVGSLIEFDKLSDELLDIHINDQLFGVGEVVKVRENFGVRVKEVISLQEKIRRLGL